MGRVADQQMLEQVEVLNKDVPELMGTTEVCRALGTTSSNLGSYVGLPEPVTKLQGGRLWRADVIKAYIRERNRRLRSNGNKEAK